MRTRLLRGRDGVTVQLVYPSTLEEYRQALDALGGSVPASGSGELDSPRAGCQSATRGLPGHDGATSAICGALPDLTTVTGRAVPVDETRALALLHDAAVRPRHGRRAVPRPYRGGRFGAGRRRRPAVRGSTRCVVSSRPARASIKPSQALDGAGLPSAVHEALSDRLSQGVRLRYQGGRGGAGPAYGWSLDLPWAKAGPSAVRPGSCRRPGA